MNILMQGKRYQVLYKRGEDRDLLQYICRREGRAGNREYLAVQIPTRVLRREMIRYLAAQEKNKNFREFLDYSTNSNDITFILDCGEGSFLAEQLRNEKMLLAERTAVAVGLIKHLVLSDFPPYFIHAAMHPERIKRTQAMDFSFAFDLSDFLQFAQVDFAAACQDIAGVLEMLFSKEQKKQAMPELDAFLFRLRRGEYADLLSVYQELLAVTALWSGKEEDDLEDKSLAFRLWEKIKRLGRFAAGAVKVATVLLAAAYLGYSIYFFIKPEAPGGGYDQIGDLEIQREVPDQEKGTG